MSARITRRRTLLKGTVAFAAAGLLISGCTSNEEAPEDNQSPAQNVSSAPAAAGGNDEPGDKVVIGFSAPAADHGWMAAISKAAIAEAEKYSDVELKVAEGTNDVNHQISLIETFINDGVDAIVLLPFDGDALTEVATKATEAGITVINVDREFSSPFAARATVLGDNYGMGVSAGHYICEELDGKSDAVVAEIAGIDSLPLTKDRSQGFADSLEDCGLKVTNRVAADFTIQGGEQSAANLLQAAPKIDAMWNHDDDQGVGVMAAIESAGRDEFFMVGGAGSADVMKQIQSGDSVLRATVVYPSTQAADGIKLARLAVQGRSMGDLASPGVPKLTRLYAPVVTKDNVEDYLPAAFDS